MSRPALALVYVAAFLAVALVAWLGICAACQVCGWVLASLREGG